MLGSKYRFNLVGRVVMHEKELLHRVRIKSGRVPLSLTNRFSSRRSFSDFFALFQAFSFISHLRLSSSICLILTIVLIAMHAYIKGLKRVLLI